VARLGLEAVRLNVLCPVLASQATGAVGLPFFYRLIIRVHQVMNLYLGALPVTVCAPSHHK